MNPTQNHHQNPEEKAHPHRENCLTSCRAMQKEIYQSFVT